MQEITNPPQENPALTNAYKLAQSKGYKKDINSFKTLISNDEVALNNIYNEVKTKGYKKDINSFKELVGVSSLKKKDGTISASLSTSDSKKQESVPKNGSLGSQDYEYKPVYDERGREVYEKDTSGKLIPKKEKVLKGYASSTEEREIVREEVKQKASKPITSSIGLKKYEEETKPTEEEINKITTEIDDKINQKGFGNGFIDGLKKGSNFLSDVFTTIGTFGTETKGPNFDLAPYSKEQKQAKEELTKEFKGDVSKFSDKDILDRTKQIVLDKKIEGLIIDKNNKFLSNLPENDKRALELEKIANYKTITAKDKYLATEASILVNETEKNAKDYNVIKAIVLKNNKEGKETPKELLDYGIELEGKLNNAVIQATDLENKIIENTKDIGSVEEEIDFLKRIYSTKDKFITNVKLGFGDFYMNFGVKQELAIGDAFGIIDDKRKQEIIDQTIDWENAKQVYKNKQSKDVSFENLKLNNFGEFLFQELGTQIPIFTQIALPGGVISIGLTSAFDKYSQMEMESNQVSFLNNGKQYSGYEKENGKIVSTDGFEFDKNDVTINSFRKTDYNKAQMIATAIGFGAAESVLGALPTKGILSRSVRSFEQAGQRQLLLESGKQYLKRKGVGVIESGSMESVTEGLTQVTQNLLDKAVLGKKEVGLFDNVGHASFSGGMLGASMTMMPTVAGLIMKPFSENKQSKEINENLQMIFNLQEQLNNNSIEGISKQVIQDKISALETRNKEVLTSIANKTKGVSEEVFNAIVDVNKKQEILRIQATEINSNSNIDKKLKDQLISDLESQFNALEAKRSILVSDKVSILDALSDSESTKLKQQAAAELIKQAKLEGKTDDKINFTEEDVNKKAVELYNQSKKNATQQEATTTETKQEAQPQTEIKETEQEALETPIKENETAPSQVDNVDGNIPPIIESIAEVEQANNDNGNKNIQQTYDGRNVETKKVTSTKVRNPKTKEFENFDVDIENGNVIEIRNPKTGRIVPEFIEIVNKKTKKVTIKKNSNWTSIESDALGLESESKIKEINKNILSNFIPTTAYQAALDFFARGGKILLDSIQREIGHVDAKWATNQSNKEGLNSIESVSENLAEKYTNLDQTEIRNELIEVINTFNNIQEVKDEIINIHSENKTREQEQEARAFISSLSPQEFAQYEAIVAEDFMFEKMSEEEIISYFENKYQEQQQYYETESGIQETNEPSGSVEGNSIQESNTQTKEEQKVRITFGAFNEFADIGVLLSNGDVILENGEIIKKNNIDSIENIDENQQKEATPEDQIEFDNNDIEDDDIRESQGFFNGSRQNQRDLLLSKNGSVKRRFPFQKIFKRVWANTFKSNSGLKEETAEVVRSRNRILAAYTDHINQEANAFNLIIKDIKKYFPKDFNKKLIVINDYLSGDKSADISFLSQEQKDKIDYFRERIDSLSKSLITLLENKLSTMTNKASIEATESLIDTIKSNMGIYITRNYQIFSDNNYRDIITGNFEEINKEGQLRIRNAINYLIREEGLSREEATKSLAEYLAEIRKHKTDFIVQSSGSAVSNFFKKRKNIPKEFRELLGESKDPTYNYINTVYKISQYLGNIEYQYNLREHLINSNIASLEPKLGYEKIVGSGDGWKILNDIYVPVDFKEAFDDMQPLKTVESFFYKQWIKLAGIVKINKTVLSPQTAVRNLYSGVFLGANSGHFFLLKPKAMAIAWNTAWSTKSTQKELFDEKQKLIKLGVLGDGVNSGELMALLNDFSKEVDRMINKGTFEKIFDKAKDFYSFGDDFYKVSGFYIERDRLIKSGMNEVDAEKKAAYRISNGYPTYSYLPKNIQRLRRLPLIGTFVSFPYEYMRSTKNNLYFIKEDLEEGRTKMAYQRAAGMIIANATLGGLNMFTMSLLGLTDDDDNAIRDMLPDWQKNSKLIYLGTKSGKPLFIDGTALFPSEVIFKPISILTEKRDGREFEDKLKIATEEVLSPYISQDISFKTLMQIYDNRNEYNKKIYNSENLLEGIVNENEKILNHLMKQAGPGVYNNIAEFLRANEIKPNYFGDKFSAYGKEYTNQEALLGLLGFRVSTLNYNSAMSNYAYEIKQNQMENKGSANKLVKTSKKLTNDEVKSIVNDYAKYHNENYKKLLNIVSSGKKMGMNNSDIKKSLKLSKISNIDINYLIKGNIPKLSKMSIEMKKNFKEKIKINYKDRNVNDILNNFESNFTKMNIEIDNYNMSKIKE